MESQVKNFFRLLEDAFSSTPDHIGLLKLVKEVKKTISNPMRLAIVGSVSSGKSTLMNSIFGRELAATGELELTQHINWFKKGAHERFILHFNNGETAEYSFNELSLLKKQCNEDTEFSGSVKYIEIFCKHPLLDTFELIDTPGLHGFQKGAERTKAFLISEENTPHAIVFLFHREFKENDIKELHKFHKTAGTSINGINALACVSRSDEFENGFRDAQNIIDRNVREFPHIQRSFYSFLPIAALLSYGAKTLTVHDYNTLKKLAGLQLEKLDRMLKDESRFCNKEYPEDVTVPSAEERNTLCLKIQLTGVRLSCEMLRHSSLTHEELKAYLEKHSRVPELMDLLLSHFGNRASLIKLQVGLNKIENAVRRKHDNSVGNSRIILSEVLSACAEFTNSMHQFKEYRILKAYYDKLIDFQETELEMLLQITGEYGGAIQKRLGLTDEADMEVLEKEALNKWTYWNKNANGFISEVLYKDAARVLANSYQSIYRKLSTKKINQ